MPASLPVPRRGVVRDLGVCEYREALALQLELVAERQADRIDDTLIVVEHPEVITLGRRKTARDNVLRDDVPVVEVERGGDVTWHGPGQLVGYPILKLDESERDVHALLRAIEEALIGVGRALGLAATRKPAYTGVWVPHHGIDRKLVSIGVAVRRWVSFHGFALNVAPDLSRFGAINPCGLDAGVMTSLAELLGHPITIEDVKPIVIEEVGRALGREFR